MEAIHQKSATVFFYWGFDHCSILGLILHLPGRESGEGNKISVQGLSIELIAILCASNIKY